MRATGGRRIRGPAGPPPPASWLSDSVRASQHRQNAKIFGKEQAIEGIPQPERLRKLPGLLLPPERSLGDLTLRKLAEAWHWHVNYNKHYLGALSKRLKEALLAYISVYGSHGGVTLEGLRVLFLDERQVVGGSGSDTITHLDLSGSISVNRPYVSLLELVGYFNKKPSSIYDSTPSIPDSWDDPTPRPYTFLQVTPRFPCLTHLSLSHASSPSWQSLLTLAPHLHTLTHLSLAYWPTPSLTPITQTVPAAPTNMYKELDRDWSEAVSILRRLGKATLCLEWLDLEGCDTWIAALAWQAPPSRENSYDSGIGWNTHWRALEIIRTSQGGVPECMAEGPAIWEEPHSRKAKEEMKEVEKWIDIEKKVGIVEKMVQRTRRRGHGKALIFDKGWQGEWLECAIWLKGGCLGVF